MTLPTVPRSFAAALLHLMLLVLLVPTTSAAQPLPRSGLLPRDSARDARLLSEVKPASGFTATLFAAPPVAMYPTCLTSTTDGVLFVCVDPNLSLTATKGRGRVVRLVDDDGDGRADRYSVFAEMDSPRGLVHDGQTLYVMHPPTLTAYRDTTGDGVADVTEDLVTGLGFDLEFRGADHTTNGITMGIDGWIYIAVGDYGFRKAVGKDGRTISHRGGSVVRVRTDGSGLEIYAVGTRNTYDLAVSPLLEVFTRDNTNDGDGWDTRLHFIPMGAHMGYPTLYKNFANEHMRSLADYGSGSGTGGLWVEDAGFPPGFGNTLYTADWLTNQILRHPLTPVGGSFDILQEPFLVVPHPSDMVMDGHSTMYVASLSGGAYTYEGDSVGYVVRIRPTAARAAQPPDPSTRNAAALRALLASSSDVVRLQAQREILRRGEAQNARTAEQRDMTNGLTSLMNNTRQPVNVRVAALFTLKLLRGSASTTAITKATRDPVLRAFALRALADDTRDLGPMDQRVFVEHLGDSNPRVRMAAIVALARLDMRDAGEALVPLSWDADPAVAHTAVNALVRLNAWESALAGLPDAPGTAREGMMRALQQMHDTALVAALVSLHKSTPDASLSNALLPVLARLAHTEDAWNGDWWGTRPSFIGPYFSPVPWAGSDAIVPVLRQALDASRGDRHATLVAEFIRNRALPQGAAELLQAVTFDPSAQRQLHDMVVGQSYVTSVMTQQLQQLLALNASYADGVAQLLAAEATLPGGSMPLVQSLALNGEVPTETRARLLNAMAAVSGRADQQRAMRTFAAVTPQSDTMPTGAMVSPVETAWRRYVGDRRRVQELDQFIALSRAGDSDSRTLGFAVLLQSVRGARVDSVVRNAVVPVLNAAWQSKAAAPDLVRAVRVMRLESQYERQLVAYETDAARPPSPSPIAKGEWRPLFNGRNLDGWDIKFAGHPVGENFRNTFQVEDGLLKVRYDQWSDFNGEFGHLFFRTPYSHYIVAVEYRFVGSQLAAAAGANGWANRNNGIMVHSQSAASMGLKQDFPISLEVQLLGGLGDGTRTTGNLCTPGTHVVMQGALVTAHCINSSSVTYEEDQWVRVEALVLGDSIVTHIVNGDTVLRYQAPQMGGGAANNVNSGVLVNGHRLTRGFIALQAETAPTDFRKVELLNLRGCMDRKYRSYRAYFVAHDQAACR